MTDESGRGSRSICILKERGVCLKVPFYIGQPKEPTFVTIPYFEFIAQVRMNRTNTCDMFVKGDIVRIYTHSLAQPSNYVAIVTVLKRKSSNLYVYKRKIADILKYLPDPESETPLRRSFEVEALGIINTTRSASLPIECYKISMKSKDDTLGSPASDCGNESGDGGNQPTIWVEKGLFPSETKKVIETPTLHPDSRAISPSSLTSTSSSSSSSGSLLSQQQQQQQQQSQGNQEKQHEKQEISFVTTTNTITSFPLSEIETNGDSSNLLYPGPSSVPTTVISTVAVPVKVPKTVTGGSEINAPCTVNKGSSIPCTTAVIPVLTDDLCEYSDYYNDPYTYSFSPHIYPETYSSASESSSLHKMLSSTDTPVLSPTSYSTFPSEPSSQSPGDPKHFIDSCDDSFSSSPFILGSELAEFEEDKGEFRLSPFKFCMSDANYDSTHNFCENNETMGDGKTNFGNVCPEEGGNTGFGGKIDNDVNRSIANSVAPSLSDANSYGMLGLSSSISDNYFYGSLNSQIEENFRPQTCIIL